MNNINLQKYNYKLSTRNYSLSIDNNYKIPSIGLIHSFKILNYNELKNKNKNTIVITIGNFPIPVHKLFIDKETQSSGIIDDNIISIKELRNYIRNIDDINNDYDNNLIQFEHFLFSQQLKCTEHYYTIKNEDLVNSIFTSGINLYIDIRELKSNDNNELSIESLNEMKILDEELKIEETFWDKIYENEVNNKL